MKRSIWALAAVGVIATVATGHALEFDGQPPGPASQQRAAPGDLGMAIMSARVSESGALLAGEGATGAIRITATGQYQVDFGRDVTACFFSATARQAALILLARPRFGTPNSVFVAAYNPEGVLAIGEFQLLVYCGR